MEVLTRQALPPKNYLILLGTALCVFNSNNQFIIESILNTDGQDRSWHDLLDLNTQQLQRLVVKTISKNSGTTIANLFSEIIVMRNRIVHSFQITASNGTQILRTKTKKDHEQFDITEDYLKVFIRKNEELSDLLHDNRSY